METKTLQNNFVVGVPLWWFFDSKQGLLYFEEVQENRMVLRTEKALIKPSEQELGLTAVTKAGEHYLLWKDREIISGNSGVSSILDWELHGYRDGHEDLLWTFGLYVTLASNIAWRHDNEELPTVKLTGKYLTSNILFTDTVRLVIPQPGGRPFAAISERGVFYNLLR